MATYFGEVNVHGSRAVDDDDDESDEFQHVENGNGISPTKKARPVIVRWTPAFQCVIQAKNPTPPSICVVACGPLATGFLHACLLAHEESETIGLAVGQFSPSASNSLSQTNPEDCAGFIYRLVSQPTVIICQANTELTPEQATQWTKQVLGDLKAGSFTYVGILCSENCSKYVNSKPTSDMGVPFLRALKTSFFRGKPFCPYLEQPNTVSDLPAAVMTYCQIHNIPATLFVCYTQTNCLDLATVEALLPAIKSTPLKDLVQDGSKVTEHLHEYSKPTNTDSLLYI